MYIYKYIYKIYDEHFCFMYIIQKYIVHIILYAVTGGSGKQVKLLQKVTLYNIYIKGHNNNTKNRNKNILCEISIDVQNVYYLL